MKTQKEIEEIAEREYPIDAIEAIGLAPEYNKKSQLAFIKGYQAAQEERKWISVEDRLPEIEDNSVLVHFENGSIETVHIQDMFGDITNGFDEKGNLKYTKWYINHKPKLTHWQSLPQKPQIMEANEFENESQPSCLGDVISRLKSIRRFNLAHYREGEFSIDTEREYDGDGDYIDSYEIDDVIRELENGL